MMRLGGHWPRILSYLRPCGGQDGFILADVLVSLIITSLVIGVLLAAVSRSAISTQRTADQYRASSYARSKLAELRGAGPLVEGRPDGRFDDVFSWSLRIEKNEKLSLEHETAPLIAFDVELKVSWRRGSHLYQRFYRTMMLRGKTQTGSAATYRCWPEARGAPA
jgi:hypothetical protein